MPGVDTLIFCGLLHQRGQTRRLLLGGCISAARPGGIQQHAGLEIGTLKSTGHMPMKMVYYYQDK